MQHPSRQLWVRHIRLTNFRNYASLSVEAGPGPVVLAGPNGSGKTNLLEAVSLLAPGQGLRRAAFSEIARSNSDGGWVVSAELIAGDDTFSIGTGLDASKSAERAGRIVRVDGEAKSGSGALADIVEMVWVTPTTDGLFVAAAGERRRFLDRLILCFDPGYRARAGRFERAMQSRNRLLADGVRDRAQFEGLELIIAETGVAIAAARLEAVAALRSVIERRRQRAADDPFPWSIVEMEGTLEADLAQNAAVDVEDRYVRVLAEMRERDRGAGRALTGPHRSDFVVTHGPKSMPARVCSTGEQKALLLGLVLAHAELTAERRDGQAPILLLDEVAAHLDDQRRAALYAEIVRLGAQAWMTGTDIQSFSALAGRAQFWRLEDGSLTAMHGYGAASHGSVARR